MNAELNRANEDLHQFAYSVSHDLQEALLRDILAYTQSLGSEAKECRALDLNEITRAVLGNPQQAIATSRAEITVGPMPRSLLPKSTWCSCFRM